MSDINHSSSHLIHQASADFLLKLDDSVSISSSFESLSRIVSIIGFDSISYTLIPLSMGVPKRSPPIFLSSRDFSNDFLQHYQDANLATNDFTIRYIANGCTKTLDWNTERVQGFLATEEAQLIRLAKEEYGIRNAVTIPVEQNPHILAGFSLTSSIKDDQFTQLKSDYLVLCKSLCIHFHRFIRYRHQFRKHFYNNVLNDFTRNEQCMIDLVANGHRLKMAEDLYGIKESYAGRTLHNIYKKLEVADKAELGYLIGRHQLLELFDAL